jgi:hypothetical protein
MVETDAAGRFTFPKVPPGKFVLFREYPVVASSISVPGSRRPALTDVTILPAETKNVTVGAYTLTTRLAWPANFRREPNWQVQVWFLPETTSQVMHFAETASDVFVAEDVPAGNYRVRVLSGAVMDGRPRLKQNAEALFSVPADPSSGTLDLGEIVLQPAK